MSSSDLTKVSTSMLPMEDIATILNIQYDFMTIGEKAVDTEKVAGVDAKKIAIAVSTSDRETVKNALMLGGRPAGEYVTKEQGDRLNSLNATLTTNFADEVKELRDELYQLRLELAKSGVLKNYTPYTGYIDCFRSTESHHLKDTLGTNIADSTTNDTIVVSTDTASQIDVDDYIALYIKNMDYWHVAKVVQKLPDGLTLKFTPSTSYTLEAGKVDVYKSAGTVMNGAFCFLKQAQNAPGSREMYSCLDDDTFRLRRQIKASNTGFGYTFRLPEAQRGFLIKLGIQAKAIGAPGALMCYIIDDRNIDKFKNPVQAKRDGILLAKSQPYLLSSSYGERRIEFEFWDGAKFPLLNEKDTYDHKVRYCVIIEALEADEDNYYEILFLRNKRDDGTFGDLQLNNVTYNYTQVSDTATENALVTNDAINAADMYYDITTKEVENVGIMPFRVGLYSAKFRANSPVPVSHARLTMRINREGYFVTNNASSGVYTDGSSLPVKKQDGLTYLYDMNELRGFGFKPNDDAVIIGNNIRKIVNQNASEVVLKKGLYLDGKELPIYRAGYKAFLKAKLVEWDPEQQAMVIKDSAKIELPLAAVMLDGAKEDIKISDRLVYENTFRDEAGNAKKFNEFELQIYWDTGWGGVYEDAKYKEDFVGKIHTLALSLDRII